MPVELLTAPVFHEWVATAIEAIRGQGIYISEDATNELREFALAGFRRLQEERVLDLAEDAPARQAALREASANMQRFAARWVEIEGGGMELTLHGFAQVRRTICPLYPFC